MTKVLILENDQKISGRFRTQFRKEPVGVTIVRTAAEARRLFKGERFDMIALGGVAPSEEGQEPSLVGPGLAREFREMGFTGPIIAISSEPQAQELIKKGADWIVLHKAYVCNKTGRRGLRAVVRELLGIYPTLLK